MDKTVGNQCAMRSKCMYVLIVVALSLANMVQAVSLHMRVIDSDDQDLQQVAVGQPFFIQVEVKDMGSDMKAPRVEGLAAVHGRQTGVHMRSVNGKSTTYYVYTACADEPGTYSVGPAQHEYNGNSVSSNKVVFSASDEQVVHEDAPGKRRSQADAFLRFAVDKEHIFVGQKVECTVRFYYTHEDTALKQIGVPDFVDFSKSPAQGPHTGTEKINGTRYHYAEWRWSLLPQNTGKKMLPACSADFELPIARNNRFFGGFGAFFGGHVERKRVYSNAVHITVDPLPAYHEVVKGIGIFTNFTASLSKSMAQEGEAVVLALELQGEGNFEVIDAITLEGMPNDLKYYESKISMVEPTNDERQATKRFEFIVHATDAGDVEIPAQKFTYFDVSKKKYNTLRTQPLTLSVMKVRGGVPHNQVENQQQQENSETQKVDVLKPLSKGPWYPVERRKPIPGIIFLLLLLAPLLLKGLVVGAHWYVQYRQNRVQVVMRKRAFKYARTQLESARVSGNAAALYTIFMTLFSQRCMVAKGAFSTNIARQMLVKAGLPAHDVAEWDTFCADLERYAFTKHESQDVPAILFQRALVWIDRLEKII